MPGPQHKVKECGNRVSTHVDAGLFFTFAAAQQYKRRRFRYGRVLTRIVSPGIQERSNR